MVNDKAEEIKDIVDEIRKKLDLKDKIREEAFIKAREIRRFSTKAVREIHKENFSEALNYLKRAEEIIFQLTEEEKEFGFMREAFQEFCEAHITISIIEKKKIPKPEDLRVPVEDYIMGLGDVVGEIRRFLLDRIRKGKFEELEYYLEIMEEIYHNLLTLDYPNAIVPIRKKQDQARLILEKTRGEVTLILKQAELMKKLEKI